MLPMTETTFRHLLFQAQTQLARTLGLPASEAHVEVQMLMRRALGDVTRAWLIAHDNDAPTLDQSEEFQALLIRRLAGEPVAYILGEREFYGLNLSVGPGVLIPRPDTEVLVDAALERIPAKTACRVLDLGVGSGAIALAVALNRPLSRVVATDDSTLALEIASSNARKLGIANVDFRQGVWFSAVMDQKFDLIISNPPYIKASDPHLRQGDLRYEPLSALASGEDGLQDIRTIIREAPEYLVPGGWLLLEHGYDQAVEVAELLRGTGFSGVTSLPDLSGTLRVTLGNSVKPATS